MSTTKYTPRLAGKYKTDVVPALMKKFGYTSIMQAPKLQKICINRGVNGAVADKKLVDVAVDELSQISGQKAVATMSKKDISNFKLRRGMPIGARVTLRGEKMYEFLDRLISVALPPGFPERFPRLPPPGLWRGGWRGAGSIRSWRFSLSGRGAIVGERLENHVADRKLSPGHAEIPFDEAGESVQFNFEDIVPGGLDPAEAIIPLSVGPSRG